MIHQLPSRIVLAFCLLFSSTAYSQSAADSFFHKLSIHCGKSYEGTITAGSREGDGFTGKKLTMQVLSCEKNIIKIPFYVGDDRSRTWIFFIQNGIITLKHDHRHEDGLPDKITQYGGTSTNSGNSQFQFFPADAYTCNLLYAACSNVWWVTLTDSTFTYNLRRIGSERVFTVTFDLLKAIDVNIKPWGWKD